MKIAIVVFAAILSATAALAAESSGFGLDLIVNESTRPEYRHHETIYVEAIRGASYDLRLTNPTPYRVAVALSVDGLNTIDARHADAWSSAKWVLNPYESTVISGWQVSGESARRFFFTGENRSYSATLGKTDNLGVIEAVYFRERVPLPAPYPSEELQAPSAAQRDAAGKSEGAPRAQARVESEGALSDEYAGTGMGRRTRHDVYGVELDLERQPVASVRLRYEFHPQLVRLGVLSDYPSPLDRRERARGFTSFCPEPN